MGSDRFLHQVTPVRGVNNPSDNYYRRLKPNTCFSRSSVAPLALIIDYWGLLVDLSSLNNNHITTTVLTGLHASQFQAARKFALLLLVSLSVFSLSACQSGGANTNNQSVQSDSSETEEPMNAPASADLSADSLVAPTPLSVSLSSSNGMLTLSWDTIENQRSSSVYLFDPLLDSETLVSSSDDPNKSSYSLQSVSHQRAWHRELLRVELCNLDECLSSRRLSIADSIESTIQRMTPGVFIENERFAESMSINDSATLMAVALPLQGAIDLYLKPANTWVAAQRISLNNLSQSASRKIHMDFSSSGDTLAVFISHNNGLNSPEIRLLERLGEGWFETDSIHLNDLSGDPVMSQAAHHDNPVQLSDDGNRILLGLENQAYTFVQTSLGWSSATLLEHNSIESWNEAFNARFINESVLKSISANGSLNRIFLAHKIDQSLWLSIWQLQSDSENSQTWEKTAAYPINAIAPDNELLVRSNLDGTQIFVAGWEDSLSTDRTPVAWRYQLPQMDLGTTGTTLNSLDSIRFPPTNDTSASIRFSSDSALSQVVLGWQSTELESASPDAALTTYSYSEDTMRWVPKLELPEVYPTFAKQAFVRSTQISADASALIISIAAGNSLSSENRVGEVLSLH